MQSNSITLSQRLTVCTALIASLVVLTRSYYLLGILSGVAVYYLLYSLRAFALSVFYPHRQSTRTPKTPLLALVLGALAVCVGFLGVVTVSYLRVDPAYASIALLIPFGLDRIASALSAGALSQQQEGTPAG